MKEISYEIEILKSIGIAEEKNGLIKNNKIISIFSYHFTIRTLYKNQLQANLLRMMIYGKKNPASLSNHVSGIDYKVIENYKHVSKYFDNVQLFEIDYFGENKYIKINDYKNLQEGLVFNYTEVLRDVIKHEQYLIVSKNVLDIIEPSLKSFKKIYLQSNNVKVEYFVCEFQMFTKIDELFSTCNKNRFMDRYILYAFDIGLVMHDVFSIQANSDSVLSFCVKKDLISKIEKLDLDILISSHLPYFSDIHLYKRYTQNRVKNKSVDLDIENLKKNLNITSNVRALKRDFTTTTTIVFLIGTLIFMVAAYLYFKMDYSLDNILMSFGLFILVNFLFIRYAYSYLSTFVTGILIHRSKIKLIEKKIYLNKLVVDFEPEFKLKYVSPRTLSIEPKYNVPTGYVFAFDTEDFGMANLKYIDILDDLSDYKTFNRLYFTNVRIANELTSCYQQSLIDKLVI